MSAASDPARDRPGHPEVDRLPVDAPLETGDGAAVLAAYADVFLPQGRDPQRMLAARRAERGYSCRYVPDGDQVVAFAWGASVPAGSWWPTQLAAVLDPAVVADVLTGSAVAELGVRSSHRRRGLGRLVLAALLADLEPLGGPVHLGTEAANDASRRLYEEAGFRTITVFRYPSDTRRWRLMRKG